jgi:hypothetical protein
MDCYPATQYLGLLRFAPFGSRCRRRKGHSQSENLRRFSVRYSEMDLFVTRSTQGDQIPFRVAAELATGLNVMNL